jgi:hypothetical protein
VALARVSQSDDQDAVTGLAANAAAAEERQ